MGRKKGISVIQLPRLYLEGWGKGREKSKLEEKQVDFTQESAELVSLS